MRKTPLITDHIYHIFNRGVNKGDIFFNDGDYYRFYLAAVHYTIKTTKFSYERSPTVINDTGSLNQPRVEILAYCLMPNHFHFLIKQSVDNGITSYMRQLTNSYSHYANIKYKRVGPLFGSRFKNVLIETEEQLIHVSRYIHLNPLILGLVPNLNNYRWSSYLDFLNEDENRFLNRESILEHFKNPQDYQKFVLDQADYARKLDRLKHLMVDED